MWIWMRTGGVRAVSGRVMATQRCERGWESNGRALVGRAPRRAHRPSMTKRRRRSLATRPRPAGELLDVSAYLACTCACACACAAPLEHPPHLPAASAPGPLHHPHGRPCLLRLPVASLASSSTAIRSRSSTAPCTRTRCHRVTSPSTGLPRPRPPARQPTKPTRPTTTAATPVATPRHSHRHRRPPAPSQHHTGAAMGRPARRTVRARPTHTGSLALC